MVINCMSSGDHQLITWNVYSGGSGVNLVDTEGLQKSRFRRNDKQVERDVWEVFLEENVS